MQIWDFTGISISGHNLRDGSALTAIDCYEIPIAVSEEGAVNCGWDGNINGQLSEQTVLLPFIYCKADRLTGQWCVSG